MKRRGRWPSERFRDSHAATISAASFASRTFAQSWLCTTCLLVGLLIVAAGSAHADGRSAGSGTAGAAVEEPPAKHDKRVEHGKRERGDQSRADPGFDGSFPGTTWIADLDRWQEKRFRGAPVAAVHKLGTLRELDAVMKKEDPEGNPLFSTGKRPRVSVVFPADLSAAERAAFLKEVADQLQRSGLKPAKIAEMPIHATEIAAATRRANALNGKNGKPAAEPSDEAKARAEEQEKLMPLGRWLVKKVAPQAKAVGRTLNPATMGARTKLLWKRAKVDEKQTDRRTGVIVGIGKTALGGGTWFSNLKLPWSLGAFALSTFADQFFTVFGPEIQHWKQAVRYPGTVTYKLAKLKDIGAVDLFGEAQPKGEPSWVELTDRIKSKFQLDDEQWARIEASKILVWEPGKNGSDGGIRINLKPLDRLTGRLVKEAKKERKVAGWNEETSKALQLRRKLRAISKAVDGLPVMYGKRTPINRLAAKLNSYPFLQTMLGDQMIAFSFANFFRFFAWMGGATAAAPLSLEFLKMYAFGMPGMVSGAIGGWGALALRKIGAVSPRGEAYLYMLYGAMFTINGLLLPLGSSWFYFAVGVEWAVNLGVGAYYHLFRLLSTKRSDRMVFVHPRIQDQESLFTVGYKANMLTAADKLALDLDNFTDDRKWARIERDYEPRAGQPSKGRREQDEEGARLRAHEVIPGASAMGEHAVRREQPARTGRPARRWGVRRLFEPLSRRLGRTRFVERVREWREHGRTGERRRKPILGVGGRLEPRFEHAF